MSWTLVIDEHDLMYKNKQVHEYLVPIFNNTTIAKKKVYVLEKHKCKINFAIEAINLHMPEQEIRNNKKEEKQINLLLKILKERDFIIGSIIELIYDIITYAS